MLLAVQKKHILSLSDTPSTIQSLTLTTAKKSFFLFPDSDNGMKYISLTKTNKLKAGTYVR